MTTPRNGSLDYAKLLSVFGIVWFHTGAMGAAYGYAGLSVFLVLLVFYVPRAAHAPFVTYAQGRALRLLWPWLLCCILYGGLKLIEVATTSATLDTEFTLSMWVTGPALHLWFLPFAFVVGLVIYPLAHVGNNRPLAVVFGLLTLIMLAMQTPLPVPFAQWTYALPALCFGLCLRFSGATAVPQIAITCMIGVIGLSAGWGAALQLMLAGLLLALCTAFPLPASALSDKCARMTLTVYLLHPLVAALLQRAIATPSDSAVFALLNIALTTALAFALDHLWHSAEKRT